MAVSMRRRRHNGWLVPFSKYVTPCRVAYVARLARNGERSLKYRELEAIFHARPCVFGLHGGARSLCLTGGGEGADRRSSALRHRM